MKRPFWIHQLVDYILGIVLMAQANEAPKPIVPLVVGLVVLINAACVDGPLAAYKGLSRPRHRIADIVLTVIVLAIGIAGYGLKGSNQTTFIAVAILWAVVILGTNYTPKAKREKIPRNQLSTEAGKVAGRAVAGGINSWRGRKGSG
jgi:FtsH-binding integral membrane protein